MPQMDGVEATARIRTEFPDIRVLGVSMLPRSETADAIEHAGAAGFFVKGTDTQRLIDHLLAFHASRGAGDRAVRSADSSARPARRRSSSDPLFRIPWAPAASVDLLTSITSAQPRKFTSSRRLRTTLGCREPAVMNERELDEVIADIEDIKTNIENVRLVRPEDPDKILDQAADSLEHVIDTLEPIDETE